MKTTTENPANHGRTIRKCAVDSGIGGWEIHSGSDEDGYENPNDAEPILLVLPTGLNAAEGIARNTSIDMKGKTPPHGQVQYPFADDSNDRYVYWFDRKDPEPTEF